MSHVNDRIPFTIPSGLPGTAMVMLTDLPDGRKLVTCANENQEGDAPVNMVVEQLFKTVCDRHRLDPARVVWVEYNSETLEVAGGRVGGWELVTWAGGPGREPEWTQMSDETWQSFGVEQPPPSPWDQPARR